MRSLLVTAVAFALVALTTHAAAGVEYDIKITAKAATGTRTRDGKREAFSFAVEDEGGLIILNRRSISEHTGDKDWATAHPFSFAGPQPTKIKVEVPGDYFLLSSFRESNGKLTEYEVSQFVVIAAKKNLWTKHQFEVLGTNFELVTPKTNPHIEAKHWEKSVRTIWKAYCDRFGSPSDHIVFVDLQGPISGGPLGENVLGVFATDKMNAEFHEDMKANLGWDPKPSTRDYVKAYYPKSANRWQEYLAGTFSHELGHLFFGFGMTREHVSSAEELWFSLGLGMVYDMEITKGFTGNAPQLELDIIKSWRDRYAKLADIDQRLVKPDKTNDGRYSFDRKKVFAHGKAAHYLMVVREKVGKSAFDKAVKSYLKKCRGCTEGYSDFKRFLMEYAETLSQLEREQRVL